MFRKYEESVWGVWGLAAYTDSQNGLHKAYTITRYANKHWTSSSRRAGALSDTDFYEPHKGTVCQCPTLEGVN